MANFFVLKKIAQTGRDCRSHLCPAVTVERERHRTNESGAFVLMAGRDPQGGLYH
jgi:hypothetical protein